MFGINLRCDEGETIKIGFNYGKVGGAYGKWRIILLIPFWIGFTKGYLDDSGIIYIANPVKCFQIYFRKRNKGYPSAFETKIVDRHINKSYIDGSRFDLR